MHVNILKGQPNFTLSVLPTYPNEDGKPARLGICQMSGYGDGEFSRSFKIAVMDDYPSRKPSKSGQVGWLTTHFGNASACIRDQYVNFTDYTYFPLSAGCINYYMSEAVSYTCNSNRKYSPLTKLSIHLIIHDAYCWLCNSMMCSEAFKCSVLS